MHVPQQRRVDQNEGKALLPHKHPKVYQPAGKHFLKGCCLRKQGAQRDTVHKGVAIHGPHQALKKHSQERCDDPATLQQHFNPSERCDDPATRKNTS